MGPPEADDVSPLAPGALRGVICVTTANDTPASGARAGAPLQAFSRSAPRSSQQRINSSEATISAKKFPRVSSDHRFASALVPSAMSQGMTRIGEDGARLAPDHAFAKYTSLLLRTKPLHLPREV